MPKQSVNARERANQRRRKRRKAPIKSFADEPRYKLQLLADSIKRLVEREAQLLKHGKPFPLSISPELAEWFASGIRDYLGGQFKTIDHALGLVPSRGNPGKPQWTRKRIIEAEYMLAEEKDERGKPLTINSVAKRFNIQPATLKEQLKRYRSEIDESDIQKVLDGLRE